MDTCCGCNGVTGPATLNGDPMVGTSPPICGYGQTGTPPISGPCTYDSGTNIQFFTTTPPFTAILTLGHYQQNCGGSGTTCFIGDTLITMPDDTTKRIDELKVEEIVKSEKETSQIQSIDVHEGEFDLYSINGSKHFVTEDHPFQTTDGWKAITPNKARENHQIEAFVLKVGDTLVKDNGKTEEITSLEKSEEKVTTTVYNLQLDNEHVYYANNYLVHNGGVKRQIPLTEVEIDDIDLDLEPIGKKSGKVVDPDIGGEDDEELTIRENIIPKSVIESKKLRKLLKQWRKNNL